MKLTSTKIALGVILLLIVSLSAVIVIFNARNRISEDDFVRNWSNVLEMQDDDTYFVYIYSDGCPACQQIRNEVLVFYRDEPSGINLYYLDVDNVSGAPSPTFSLTGVPAIIVVRDGVFVETITGIPGIRDLFQAARDGELN